jgi:hypothetical protein
MAARDIAAGRLVADEVGASAARPANKSLMSLHFQAL